MYKFTNGVVCYDAATRDKYINAGMTLIEEKPVKKEEKEIVEANLQSKTDSAGFRRTIKQSSKFDRRNK